MRQINKSQSQGILFEDYLVKLSEYYEQQGLGLIKKRYEPYRRIGKNLSGGRFVAHYLGMSGADFEIFLSNGKSGLLEVKKRATKSIAFDTLNEKQHEELSKMNAWGFLALVLVYLECEEGGWFLIPYSQFTHETKKSLNLKELEAFKVNILANGLPDLLSRL